MAAELAAVVDSLETYSAPERESIVLVGFWGRHTPRTGCGAVSPAILLPMPERLTLADSVVVSDNQVSADLSGEVVILGMQEGAYFGVDAAGARIWALLQTPRRLGELVTTLTDEYAVPADQCAADVLAFVEDLLDRGLVTRGADTAP